MIENYKLNKTVKNLLKKSNDRSFPIASCILHDESACAVKTPGVWEPLAICIQIYLRAGILTGQNVLLFVAHGNIVNVEWCIFL